MEFTKCTMTKDFPTIFHLNLTNEFLKSKFIRSMYSFSVFSITISIANDSHFVSKKMYINFILSD